MLLVEELQNSLQKHPNGKHLVVLHTSGSHYLYTQRYPRSYAKFKPECMGVDDSCTKEQLMNSYDNSILYTDNMIKSVIDQVRDKKHWCFMPLITVNQSAIMSISTALRVKWLRQSSSVCH